MVELEPCKTTDNEFLELLNSTNIKCDKYNRILERRKLPDLNSNISKNEIPIDPIIDVPINTESNINNDFKETRNPDIDNKINNVPVKIVYINDNCQYINIIVIIIVMITAVMTIWYIITNKDNIDYVLLSMIMIILILLLLLLIKNMKYI